MRHSLALRLLIASVCAAPALAAQAGDTSRTLPWDIAGEAAYRYNQPAALRTQAATTIDSGRVVNGNVAVRDASLTIRGTVRGSVVVINGSVSLLAGARVDSEVFVVGGAVHGADSASVGGRVTAYAAPLLYRLQGDEMVASHDTTSTEIGWFRRWQTRYDSAQTKFVLKARTYDRVEGLPVMLGLGLRRNWEVGQFSLEALGIYRSANSFAWTADNFGYDVTAELKRGKDHGTAYGLRFFDVVAPAESWQVSSAEIFLYSFGVRDDMRDYFNAQGGSVWGSLLRGPMTYTLTYTQARWLQRTAADPISLFNQSDSWRANPGLDEGLLHRVNLAATFDSRSNSADPWSGWLVNVDAELGWTGALTEGSTSPIVRDSSSTPGSLTYGRGWLDVRSYNRVSPQGHLDFHLALGSQLGGGALPLERRFSMGGPGSLPGYAFRQMLSPDVFTCSDSVVPAGQPAQCDRLLLAQVEYRADFTLRMFKKNAPEGESAGYSLTQPMSWVLFTDAGRGWITGATADGVRYGQWTLPPLYTFRTDMGAGVDMKWLGLYVAKTITDWQTPMRFIVRLQHRF